LTTRIASPYKFWGAPKLINMIFIISFNVRTFHNVILLWWIRSNSLMDNTILRVEFTEQCIVFAISITFYYLYLFVKLIFNLFLVMFKHFKSFIFYPEQIGITIPCAIIYKIIQYFFSSLVCTNLKSSISEWIKFRGSLFLLTIWKAGFVNFDST